jgi:hypothetical protein
MKNPTLVKNMKHVKWKAIPPLRGPDPRGLIKEAKEDKQDKLEKNNGRRR